jgi:hypothetical protein
MEEINVGIVKKKPGWTRILRQEGIPFKQCDVGDGNILIINTEIREIERVRKYIKDGGHILTSIPNLGKIFGIPYKKRKINYILPTNNPIFRNVHIVDIYQSGFISRASGCGLINGKYPAIVEGNYGDGYYIGLPFDVNRVILDKRARRKAFYSRGNRFPDEVVSVVSKGEVRKLVINSLKQLFFRRGIPFIHLWYYPGKYRSIFGLRIDTDFVGTNELLKSYKILRDCKIEPTFFIDVKSAQNGLSRLNLLKDTGVHCWEHKTYSDFNRNYTNIKKAKEYCEKSGLGIAGFVSPYGMWNKELGRALEKLNFRYSSEFSLDYDDLPFYEGKILQIPIHPICYQSLKLSGKNESQIIDYFKQIAKERLKTGEPLFLYSHPKSISHWLKECIPNDVPVTDFTSFYKWWEERNNISYSVRIEKNKIHIDTESSDSRFFLHIVTSEREALVPLKKEIEIDKLNWRPRPSSEFDEKLIRTKKVNTWLFMRDIEERLWRSMI